MDNVNDLELHDINGSRTKFMVISKNNNAHCQLRINRQLVEKINGLIDLSKMALMEEMESEPELIYELIITIIDVLSIFANLLLVITIVRSKIMRTRTNIYILNVSIADLLTLLVLLIYYLDKRILHYTRRQENYKHIQCILTNLEISLQILTMTFVIILVSNCLFNLKFMAQGTLLVLIWNFVFLSFYVNAQYCRGELTFIQGAIYVAFFTILLLILIAKGFLRCRNRGDITRDSAFRVNFATIFMCLCLTSWIVNISADFCFKKDSLLKHYIMSFGTSVKVGKNIALAFYLFKYNEMFKDSLMALFNCRSFKVSESVNYSTDQTSIDISMRNEKF